MKKTITTAISSLLAAASLHAAVDVSVGYNSDYYFRGIQLADDFIDASIEYSEGAFTVGVWTAQPLDSIYVQEYDVYAGWGTSLTDGVSLSLGLTGYIYSEGKSTWEPYIGLSFDEAPLAPSLTFFYDLTLQIFTGEAGFGYSIAIDDASGIDLGVSVGYAATNSDSSTYYVLSAGYSYAFSESSSFSASVNYTDGNNVTQWDDGIYFTVGMSMGF
jgi:uncharacterized protein (TIGR02001 family)